MKRDWRVISLVALIVALTILVAWYAKGQRDAGSQNDATGSSPSAAYVAASGVTDYSLSDSWHLIPEITKDVDTFYIYSTGYMGFGEGDPTYASLDNGEMVEGVFLEYATEACAYEDSTNVFVPYYRQASMKALLNDWEEHGNIDTVLSASPYEDICAALDYYFENYNEGRPFIIAGHSQGSALCNLVLSGYFKDHPEYLDRMVAAYVLGYSVTSDFLDANPHLSFATGEDDTGVIVSWNTEGPQNVEAGATNVVLLPNAISINPLNWTLDETYAPASDNLGSYVLDEQTGKPEFADVGADAKVDLARGVVVTNADYKPIELPEYFGPASFHNGDYPLYFNNIKDNVAKRIAAYQSAR